MKTKFSLIVDDGSPVNTMVAHHPEEKHIRDIPNDFLKAFTNLIQKFGVKGKFTVLPNPIGLGRIDHKVEDVSSKRLQEWLKIIRDEISVYFDITPEIITHNLALDLKTKKFLDLPENIWSFQQNKVSLSEYIGFALEILNNVGLIANGVTSPWNFGEKVENDYALAVLEAEKAINGISKTWYFLHSELGSYRVEPRIMFWNSQKKEGVVSIVGSVDDFAWKAQKYISQKEGLAAIKPEIDKLISPEREKGRILELVTRKKPVVIVTHWQSLFSNGTAAGLLGFEELLKRISFRFGKEVEWVCCSELAQRKLQY